VQCCPAGRQSAEERQYIAPRLRKRIARHAPPPDVADGYTRNCITMDISVAYIVFGIAVLHLLAGLGWVLYKMSHKPPSSLGGEGH
jgi:hypothetical protein